MATTRKLSSTEKCDPTSRPGSPHTAISSEEAFLETYFLVLSQFGFDKAKELAEKQSNSKKGSLSVHSMWFSLLDSLVHLAVAEKTYLSLSFVNKKRFRKDSLHLYYNTLEKELEKLCEVCSGSKAISAPLPEKINRGLVAELCRHLYQFVQARQECMKFYENMFVVGIGVSVPVNTLAINYGDLVKMVETIRSTYEKLFHHPYLDPIKSSFSVEMDLLHHLFQAQCDLAQWKFMPSLLHLHESKAKLLSWNKVLPASSVKDSFTGSLSVKKGFELKMFGGGSKKQIEVPLLFQWLARFHACLLAKFSLYFHSVLSEQSSPSEMKTLTAKASVDYVNKMASFLRRADDTYICLTLDTRDLRDSYKGPGYHLPHVKVDPPTGLHTYPAIFSYPSECPSKLWPGVVSLIQDREEDLSQEKLVHFFDAKGNMTYFLTNVEKQITLVVIFKGRKNERDSHVVNFFQDITSSLRNIKVLNILKMA